MLDEMRLVYEAVISTPAKTGSDNADIPQRALKAVVAFNIPSLGSFALPALISRNTRPDEYGNWRITLFDFSGHVGIQHYGFDYPKDTISFDRAHQVLLTKQPWQMRDTIQSMSMIVFTVVKPELLGRQGINGIQVRLVPYESGKGLLQNQPEFLEPYTISGNEADIRKRPVISKKPENF